jgi:hypothetical protein
VFLKKLLNRKGICSKAYLQQVLQPVVFLLFNQLGLEYIFIEDGSKVDVGNVMARYMYTTATVLDQR